MTQERGKLPVEPLPVDAWKRIREGVFTELECEGGASNSAESQGVRTAWRYFAACAVLVAIAAVAAVALIGASRRPEQAAALGTTSRIVTAGSVTRATVGEATLEAAPESELVATGSDAGGWTVVLERGRVVFAVPKREKRPAFRVQAASVAVEVVGTRFTVERAGDRVGVSVERGTVRVTSQGETRLLGEGEEWATERDIDRSVDPPEPPGNANSPERPRAQAAPSGSPKRVPAAPQGLSPRERYEGASRLEATDPGGAVAIYLELARGNDAWAANALYAAGRLEFERGRLAPARRLLDAYQTRFPNGRNAHEARELLERGE